MLSCLFFPIPAPVSGRLWLDLDSASPPWSLGSTLWLHPIPQSAVQELFSFQSRQQPNCLGHRCGVNIFRVWVNPILSLLSDCFSSCTRVWFFTLILTLFSQMQWHFCFSDLQTLTPLFCFSTAQPHTYSHWLQHWCSSAQFILEKVHMWVHGKVFALTFSSVCTRLMENLN